MIKKISFIVAILVCSRALAQPDYHREIKQLASEMYASFTKTGKRGALLSFKDTSRLKWNNLPLGLRARAGVAIGNMTNEQRMLVHRLLSAALSSQGYLKATGIMHLDELVNRFYDSMYVKKEITPETYAFVTKLQWSPSNYYFAFFGAPADSQWGFKLEGHHLSINFTFSGDTMSVTPFFVGTDPAEFLFSEYAGWRVLGQEEDLAIKLVRSLSPDQQKKAVQSTEVPRDIITAAESGKRLVDNWGIKASELDKNQNGLLRQIIREFVFNLDHVKAIVEFDKIEKAGMNNIYFGWIGEQDESKPHYYVINGPTFLIEFDNSGGPRQRANHIHAIWREKGNEYGEDVLKKHYKTEDH